MIRTCVLCEATSAGTAVRFPNNTSKICSWCQGQLRKTARGFCPRCETAYPLVEMRDGYCAAHKRAMNQAYRMANRERERLRAAAYRKANPRPRRVRVRPSQHAYRQARAAANPNYWRERYQRAKARAFERLFAGG